MICATRALLAASFLFAWSADAVPASPPVELAETRPVETTLGNPALPTALDVWLEMIAGARNTLDLEQFYLAHWPEEPLAPVLAAIGAAAGRGVRVRLLLDRGMAATYPSPADSLGRVPGIEVRLVDFRALAGGAQHAKLILADGREAFIGSPNLDWRALKHIHELGVRVRDPRVAAAFGGVFDLDWAAADTLATPVARAAAIAEAKARARAAAAAAPFALAQSPGDTVRLVPGWSPLAAIPDSTHWDRTRVATLIDGARDDIAIELLTYGVAARGARDTTIDDSLRRAAARGVRVRLLVSDWQAGGKGMAATQDLALVPNIAVKMITIPEWSGGYIPFARVQPCKFMAVDGEAVWIGTSNWDPSYWFASRNLSLTLWNRPLTAAVMATFERSWNDPGAVPVDPATTYEAKIRGRTPPPGRAAYGR
jgi:phosphatidylserine/phosphatidylglycerophosphate/cardiolipin synthase-like enzyme